MTLLGAFFIPLAILCFFWRPQHLLPLLIFASVFEAGSVFNGAIGHFVFGVSPFYFIEICVALRLFLWIWHHEVYLPSSKTPARGISVLLLAFLVWSFGSALVMPRLFAGIPVYAPREMEDWDMVLGNLVPLSWTLSNLAQGTYLALNVAAVLFAFHVTQTTDQAVKLAKALGWAVFTVVSAGVLQQLAFLAGWSFPYSIFSNNPNNPFYSHPLDQEVNGFLRVSSTFGGPVFAGSFVAAVACGLLASYLRGRRGARCLLGLLAVFGMLVVTASTTGYLAVGVMVCVLAIYFSPFGGREPRVQPSLLKGWTVVIVAILCITGFALVFIPSLSQALTANTVEKSESIDFAGRVAADLDALAIFENTYGLGVGLGSSRHSSLIMTLLSTVGIVGTSLLALVIYRIVKFFPGRPAPSMLHMSFWSLIGLLVAESMTVPDINRPVLWALLLVVVTQSNVSWIAASNSREGRATEDPNAAI